MKTRLLITFVILGLAIAVLMLLLIMPSYILADITYSSLPFISNIIIESEQYEPVISFKKKYPDYTVIIPDQPNPGNEKIVYQYRNSSLNRIETLSIVVTEDDGIFANLTCEDSYTRGSGGSGFALRYYTDGDVDDFKCAEYSVDSDTLKRLHSAKASLENSDIPIKSVTINYDDNALYVIVYDSSQEINDKKINDILLAENIPALVAYYPDLDSWDSDGEK
jgi:hypothetical protein